MSDRRAARWLRVIEMLAAPAALMISGCSYQSPLLPPPPDAEAPPPDAGWSPAPDAAPAPEPPRPSSAMPGAGGGVSCALDADCTRGARCEASACVEGCLFHDECPGSGRDCHPHGICLDPAGHPQRPAPAAPVVEEVHFEGALSGVGIPPAVGAVRVEIRDRFGACAATAPGGMPSIAARVDVITPHPHDIDHLPGACAWTVSPGADPVGRAPVRVRVASAAGRVWVEHAHTDPAAQRLVGLLTAQVDETPLRLPVLLYLDAPLDQAPVEGVVEAAGSPMFVHDTRLDVAVEGDGWVLTARGRHDSTLLGGPFADAHRVETSLRLEVAPAVDGAALWSGSFSLGVADGARAPRRVTGAALLWPAPLRPAPPRPPALSNVLTAADDVLDGQCRDHLDVPMDDETLAACLAGDGCCDGPGVWSAGLDPRLATLWASLRSSREGAAPHLSQHCGIPIEGCAPDEGDPLGEPCFDWPICGGDRPTCSLPPAVTELDHAACAAALDASRRGQVLPFTAEPPPCVDPLRAVCAAALHGRAGDRAAADALHAGLLRAGVVAAWVDDSTDAAALDAALDRLSFPLRERLRAPWRPARGAAAPPSEEVVEAFTEAAAEWVRLAEQITLDAERAPALVELTHRRALDGVALVATVDEMAADRLLGEAFDEARAALTRQVERLLWANAERRARPMRRVLTPTRAGALADDADEALTAATPRLDEHLLDLALRARDRARVAVGRLEARRDDFDVWVRSLPDEAAKAAAPYRGIAQVAPLAPIDAALALWAAHPLAGPLAIPPGHRADAPWSNDGIEAADTLARLATPLAANTPAHPCHPMLRWPGALDGLVDASRDAWLHRLAGERERAIESLCSATDALVRLRAAHATAVRVHLAERLRASPLSSAGHGAPRGVRAAALAATEAHYRASPRDAATDGWQPEPVVIGIAETFGFAADVELRDRVLEASLPGADPVISPAQQWRDHLERHRVPGAGAFAIELDVPPRPGECARRLVAVRVEAIIGETARPLPTLRLTPLGPRLDHRCADGAAVVVLGDPGAISPGPIDADSVGSPAGRWRLDVAPSPPGLPPPEAWSDIRVTFDYQARRSEDR